MTGLPIPTLGLVLLVASLVAIVSRRLHLPYSVGLVAAGIALALLPIAVEMPLSRDLIFDILLPPLVFEAAMQLPWKYFRRNLPVTLLLAFPGVMIAAAVVAGGMHWAVGWGWAGAAMFGVLIAATDPVSVIAAFKELGVRPRLGLLVEAESLINDGAAAVLFGLVVAAAGAGVMGSPLAVAAAFAWTVAGGILVGVAVAGAALAIAGRTSDHLVEITLTAIAAYGSFLLAEHWGMSGVLASLAAGLVVGNLGQRGALHADNRDHLLSFWEFAAFLANSIVFILIGGQEAHLPLSTYWDAAAIAIVLVLAGRAAAVYPLCLALRPTTLRVDIRYQHVLFWGGLRGALALALALAVPASVPERREMVVVAFAVVAFSIFVQGLTMPWLTRRLGVLKADAGERPFRGDVAA